MARARTIKPSFFKNEDLAELSPHARLLFIGLWTLADREGRLEHRPKRIAAELFPYEHDIDVTPLIDALHKAGFIIRYEVGGERYIAIPNFAKHQHINPKEQESEIPAPDDPEAVKIQICTSTNLDCDKDQSRLSPVTILHHTDTSLYPLPSTLYPSRENPASADADGGELFSESKPPEPLKADPKSPSPLESEILSVAQKIHDRHPKYYPVESANAVGKQLRLIAKRVPSAERIERIRLIDRNHEVWCNSERWRDEGGKFAKALKNWLAPTEERYLDAPPCVAPPPTPSPRPKYFVPQYSMPTIQPPAETEEAS